MCVREILRCRACLYFGVAAHSLVFCFSCLSRCAVYEMVREAQLKPGQKKEDLNALQVMLAGGTGGIAYWLTIYPVDVLKTTLQSDHTDPAKRRYKGVADAASQIYREHGIKGFFRGFTPCLARAFPANGEDGCCTRSHTHALSV